MEILGYDEIEQNDVVVVEALLKRYDPKQDKVDPATSPGAGSSKGRGYTPVGFKPRQRNPQDAKPPGPSGAYATRQHYTAVLDLVAVSLVAKGKAPPTDILVNPRTKKTI